MSDRRRFLQKTALASLGFPFLAIDDTSFLTPLKHHSEGVLKVAIMGLGGYANRVARAMKQCTRAKITGIISGTPSKIKEWQKRYSIPDKNCYNYENYTDLKNNPDIDAVYIITPNALHCAQAISVAKAGKHVICEKPMAINAEEGRQMVTA